MLDTVLCEFGERLFHHVGILLFHEGADSEILLEGGVVGVVVVLRKGERTIGGHDELLGVLTDLEDIISIEGQAHGGQILVVGGVEAIGDAAGPTGEFVVALGKGSLPLLGLVDVGKEGAWKRMGVASVLS